MTHSEKITGFRLAFTEENPRGYDFPQLKVVDGEAESLQIQDAEIGSMEMSEISAESMRIYSKDGRRVMNTAPYMKCSEIREIARKAGCHIYAEGQGLTLYGDNRFLGVFNNQPWSGTIQMSEEGCWVEVTQGRRYNHTKEIQVSMSEKSGLLFVRV